jgi:uncharacterized protein
VGTAKKENLNEVGKVVGREEEKEVLREVLASNKAEFVVVYGRRRVGKTYLVRNYMASSITTFGLQKTMYSEEIVTNTVVLEDLFKEV